MSRKSVSDEAEAVVRRNAEEVQSKRRFEFFEELFADDFVDHVRAGSGRVHNQVNASDHYPISFNLTASPG